MRDDDDWDMREGNDNLIGLVLLMGTAIGSLLVFSVASLFFLDYLFLGNIIHWSFEFAWGAMILLYSVLFFKWSPNPTDWLPIKFGHKIQWDFNLALNNEITKWLKENISPFMYARENYNIYYFLKKSDYVAFKLRWT